jgi:drug/metabolite transporter (DMT)-like permease
VLGETLTEVEALGCVLVLSFVVVASIETSGSDHASRTGIGLSLVACVGFGLYLFLQGELADELGWLLPILVSRVVAVAMLCALLAPDPATSRGGASASPAWSAAPPPARSRRAPTSSSTAARSSGRSRSPAPRPRRTR